MKGDRVLIALNVSLGIVSLFLVLSLFDISLPSIGKAYDVEAAHCFVGSSDEFTELPNLEQCCFEARKQLSCEQQKGIINGQAINWECRTGGGPVSYLLNGDAFTYCQDQNFWK